MLAGRRVIVAFVLLGMVSTVFATMSAAVQPITKTSISSFFIALYFSIHLW